MTSMRTRATALSLALSLALTTGAVLAEDGTSGSTPTPTTSCTIHVATFGQPTASPIASPVATPIASPVASPVASPKVEEDALTPDLAAATDSILTCMSENNASALTGITSPEFRGSWTGLGDAVSDEDLAALLQWMPQLHYDLVSLDDAQAEGNSATATVVYTVGREVHTAHWSYTLTTVDGSPAWQVTAEKLQTTTAPKDAAALKITIADGSFTFAPTSVAGTDIRIDVSNTGAQEHEVLILRVADGTTASDIAAAPTGIPDGATFIAQATVPAGESGTLVLTDVRSGTYTVVDLLPDASGIPNISTGMIGTFTVTKP